MGESRHVVVSRAKEGDGEYVRAVAANDEDEANELLAEAQKANPGQFHEVVEADLSDDSALGKADAEPEPEPESQSPERSE